MAGRAPGRGVDQSETRLERVFYLNRMLAAAAESTGK
jgi:hypothetical protein